MEEKSGQRGVIAVTSADRTAANANGSRACRRWATFTIILTSMISLLTHSRAHAAPWHWSYRVLRSAHFELIFREDQKPLAKRYLLAAEQAHELVFPLFKEGPGRTIIVLEDDTDLANGSADFLPYLHITVNPVLPNTVSSIDEYGDWMLEMMVHEYTHVLNMYPAHGFYTLLKPVFGSIIRPNAVLPRWYLEGLAVYTESVYTDHGRLRSTETAANARAFTLDAHWDKEDIARINQSDIPTFPYGERPYLYGGWWWANVEREHGASTATTWNQNYARRLPFLLNGPMHEQTAHSAAELLERAEAQERASADQQIAALKRSGATTSRALLDEAGDQSIFSISPSGQKLLYAFSAPGFGTQVRLRERTSPGQDWNACAPRTLFRASAPLQVRWLDENRVLFDQLDLETPQVTYRDVYLFDLQTGKSKALTRNARAQEASAAPSAKFAALIQNDGGRNHLSLLNLENGELRPLLHSGFNQRFSSPEFLNENEILFVVRDRNGEESLKIYALNNRQIRPANFGLKAAQNLRKTANGFFITDAGTGVRNGYWLHDGHAEAITNTLTDVQSVDYDPQRREVLAVELTSEGRRLHVLPLAKQSPARIPPTRPNEPPKSTIEKIPVQEESYQPIAYLYPHYWIPFIYQVEGGMLFQGLTSVSDPIGRNTYSLLGSYDTVTRKGSYGATYANTSLPSEIDLSYFKSYSYLGIAGATIESQAASLAFKQAWPFNSRRFDWSLGGLWMDTENTYRRLGPSLAAHYTRRPGVFARWWNFEAEVNHTEFLPQSNYLAYGRSYAHLTNVAQLGGGHRLSLQTRTAFSPRLRAGLAPLLGERSVSGNYMVNLVNSDFLMRGYPSAAFIGRKMVNANLEYVFPPFRVDRGWGTFPFYIQNAEMALFADTIAVDGYAYDTKLSGYVSRKLSQFHVGSGGELRFFTTAGYHMPISFTVGLYYGFDQRFGGGLSPFFSLGLGTLPGLKDKTP